MIEVLRHCIFLLPCCSLLLKLFVLTCGCARTARRVSRAQSGDPSTGNIPHERMPPTGPQTAHSCACPQCTHCNSVHACPSLRRILVTRKLNWLYKFDVIHDFFEKHVPSHCLMMEFLQLCKLQARNSGHTLEIGVFCLSSMPFAKVRQNHAELFRSPSWKEHHRQNLPGAKGVGSQKAGYFLISVNLLVRANP